ncbi:MAG: branched-chain amino acid transaminase [Planctomycetota bacterium]|jgi:branched-chain amino acid aminotransferase|nr:branched-chain amino acid transaminase [Planctomycetota bacterium]MDP7129498.1 branched-chain amino acid transaminase [Planctomycetota bacterium]MDP7250464.1 branched-chain amino acid transaminase [Planctomycetota bacterium]
MSWGQGKIWMNGELVDWANAQIHVMTHALHYGSNVFEGIRCYDTKNGPGIFRLDEHVERLVNSAKIYRMDEDEKVSFDALKQACIDVVKANDYGSCYLRPIIWRGYGGIGLNPFNCPIEVAVAAWEWGSYLGPEALEKGVNVCVSSWNRAAPNTFPSLAKAGGNYINSQLVKMEAVLGGYDEGIVLDSYGYVSEGSGENLFLIKDGALFTPPEGSAILPGITRDSAAKIAAELGYELTERQVTRENLYIVDELFFTGTAAEITPIATVDKITIGEGKRGPITTEIQQYFFELLSGEREDKFGWLTMI